MSETLYCAGNRSSTVALHVSDRAACRAINRLTENYALPMHPCHLLTAAMAVAAMRAMARKPLGDEFVACTDVLCQALLQLCGQALQINSSEESTTRSQGSR